MNNFNEYVINPICDYKQPYYNKGWFVIPNVSNDYNYYIEAMTYNIITNRNEYYVLFGKTKFNDFCRTCRKDNFGNIRIKPRGKFLEAVKYVSYKLGNVPIEYYESKDNYDVWKINF